MFGFNYKVVPVNEAKNIYKLSPTPGTLLKAFAPSLVLGVVATGLFVYAALTANDDPIMFDFTEHEDPNEN